MTKKAAEVAKVLGCDEVLVWSVFDGYDYPFQVDHREKWGIGVPGVLRRPPRRAGFPGHA